MMSFETQSMASGRRARKRRKTMLASTSGGLVSQTMLSSGRTLRSDASRSRQESSTAAGRLGLRMRNSACYGLEHLSKAGYGRRN